MKHAYISGPHLRAAFAFADKSGRRDYLNAVHVQEHCGSVMLTATNGIGMIRVFDANGAWPHPPALLRPDKAALAHMKRAGGASPLVHFPDKIGRGRVMAKVVDQLVLIEALDASQFPDVDRVIPKGFGELSAEPFVFDTDMLRLFAESVRELGGKKGLALERVNAKDAPHLVRLEDVPAFGVLMPYKDNPCGRGLPDWYVKASGAAAERVKLKRAARKAEAEKSAATADKRPEKAKTVAARAPLSDADKRARYEQRIANRRRLRAVVGWDVKLRDLSPTARAEAEARANEPLARCSLAAIAKGAKIKAPEVKSPPRLIFEARFRDVLLSGLKVNTVRKQSSHTARFKVGTRVVVEAPNKQVIGESTIRKVEVAPSLRAAERNALRAIYGASEGPWVRLTFDRVKAPATKRARNRT